MATLNDTQRITLAAAAARDDRHVLPLPETLRTPAHIVTKTVEALLERGLVAEVVAAPDDAVWRQTEGGGKTTLVATSAGLAAIGIDTERAAAAAPADKPRTGGRKHVGGTEPASRPKTAPRASTAQTGGKDSKQAAVIALLRRQQGASVPEMMAATGWQAHSVRGFMSGALKKRLGIEVVSEKGESGERRYYVAAIK
jgi:hypothetical protein